VRVYKRLAGRTPGADLRALRIDAACHLLATTDLPAKKIADMTGFGDPYQFAKVFKRTTGTTPLRFRTGRAGPAVRSNK
jgi:transcriptional regulator GlxA family with amidase domain